MGKVEFSNEAGLHEIKLPVRGGKLVVYVFEGDLDSPQAGIMFERKDGCQIDIALVEQKGGELAENCYRLPRDNKDLDLYVYENVYDEDWTGHTVYKYSDIEQSMSE